MYKRQADSVPVATPVDNLSNEPKNEMHDVPADDGVNAADLQSDIASSGKSSMSDNGQGQPAFGQNGQFDGQNVQPAGQNGPVSYTHLDVYKRQGPGWVKRVLSVKYSAHMTYFAPVLWGAS